MSIPFSWEIVMKLTYINSHTYASAFDVNILKLNDQLLFLYIIAFIAEFLKSTGLTTIFMQIVLNVNPWNGNGIEIWNRKWNRNGSLLKLNDQLLFLYIIAFIAEFLKSTGLTTILCK